MQKPIALYLQGRFVADRITREDVAKGIGYFRDALELDPGYALAWAELSRAHLNEAGYSWAPLDEGFGKARMAAERALELEPDLAEAYVALGLVQMNYDWDWQRAERVVQACAGVCSRECGSAARRRGPGRDPWPQRRGGRTGATRRGARSAQHECPPESGCALPCRGSSR